MSNLYLRLIGYPQFLTEIDEVILNGHVWLTINSGSIEPLIFRPQAQKSVTYYPLPNSIETKKLVTARKKYEFGVVWTKILEPITVEKNKFEILKTGVLINNTLQPASFSLITLELASNNKLKVSFNSASVVVEHFKIILP